MKQRNNQIEWKEVEFGNSEYFEVKKGASITKDKVTEGKIPVVAGGQQPAYYHNKSNRPGETITISGSGAYAGFVNYFKEPIFASDCSTVQIKNNLISSKYAYLFLKSYQSKIYSMQKGIAQPHVYPKEIVEIKIPIPFSNGKPDLKEQERIVSILEKAEKVRAKGNNAEGLLNEYLKSIFNEMFLKEKFEKVTLNEIGKLSMGGTPSTSIKEYWENGTINWMKSGDIKGDVITFVPNKITQKGFDKSNTTLYPKDTVVIALNGQGKTRGTTAILKIETTSNQSVVGIIIDKNKILSEYLHYNLKLRYDELRNLTGDDSRSGLNLSILRHLKIQLPPFPLQQKFAKIVEHVEGLKENVKKNKQNSEELVNSLMTKAFRGEL